MRATVIFSLMAFALRIAHSVRHSDESTIQLEAEGEQTGVLEGEHTGGCNPETGVGCFITSNKGVCDFCDPCNKIGYEMRRHFKIQLGDDPGAIGAAANDDEAKKSMILKASEAFGKMIRTPVTANYWQEKLTAAGCSCCTGEYAGDTYAAWYNKPTCPTKTYGFATSTAETPTVEHTWAEADYPLWCALQFLPKTGGGAKALRMVKPTYQVDYQYNLPGSPWGLKTFDDDRLTGGFHGCLAYFDKKDKVPRKVRKENNEWRITIGEVEYSCPEE